MKLSPIDRDAYALRVVARIHTDFKDKFGIPKQSGLVPDALGKIVFEPEFRIAEAVRGLEGYSHLWLIWGFSQSPRDEWSPTVRPPRLGGNTRMGVFATRSPFRPNNLGLSSLRLEKVDLEDPVQPVLWVRGVDMLDGSPVYDIKPYSPQNDIHLDAWAGFSHTTQDHRLTVQWREGTWSLLKPGEKETLEQILSLDPRPGYQHEAGRIYGMDFADLNLHFSVEENILTVEDLRRHNETSKEGKE